MNKYWPAPPRISAILAWLSWLAPPARSDAEHYAAEYQREVAETETMPGAESEEMAAVAPWRSGVQAVFGWRLGGRRSLHAGAADRVGLAENRSGDITMKRLTFPSPFTHTHPPVQNVNILLDEQSTPGQRTADWVVKAVGSWRFIVGQSILLVFWIVLNVTAWIQHWDPYPFILMNLFLSMQAAFTAPVIMMSQNRQAARDRLEARNDFQINQKAEEEIRVILEHLDAQNVALEEIHQQLSQLLEGRNGS
jgi:uncharacterized membrane protein